MPEEFKTPAARHDTATITVMIKSCGPSCFWTLLNRNQPLSRPVLCLDSGCVVSLRSTSLRRLRPLGSSPKAQGYSFSSARRMQSVAPFLRAPGNAQTSASVLQLCTPPARDLVRSQIFQDAAFGKALHCLARAVHEPATGSFGVL